MAKAKRMTAIEKRRLLAEAELAKAYNGFCQVYNWDDYEGMFPALIGMMGRHMIKSLSEESAKALEVSVCFDNPEGPGSPKDLRADEIFEKHNARHLNSGTFLDKSLQRDMTWEIDTEKADDLITDLKLAGFNPVID